LTGEHRHKNDTTNGQRVSRHSLPTLLCFNFFPTAQNILKFSASPQMAHLVLPNTQSQPFAKPKEPFFAHALLTMVLLKIVFWTIKF
jgi:hypothetical protein